jgi:hypothetical protein
MTDTFTVDANTGKATIVKDDAAKLDYILDWTDWLNDVTDTIATADVTVPTGLTLESHSIVGKTVVAYISGGTVGQTYQVEYKITTDGGRIDERSIYLKIKER